MRAAGEQAPLFDLDDMEGKRRSLSEFLSRGATLLVFFKVSCPVCQFTLPFLERIAGTSGLQVVGISQDDREATREFLDEFGITFPTLLDTAKSGYPVSNSYEITHVPSLFLIEPDGRISKSVSGFSKRDL